MQRLSYYVTGLFSDYPMIPRLEQTLQLISTTRTRATIPVPNRKSIEMKKRPYFWPVALTNKWYLFEHFPEKFNHKFTKRTWLVL